MPTSVGQEHKVCSRVSSSSACAMEPKPTIYKLLFKGLYSVNNPNKFLKSFSSSALNNTGSRSAILEDDVIPCTL